MCSSRSRMSDADVRTEAAWTEASATDRLMFSVLANASVVDRDSVPPWNLADLEHPRSPPRIQDMTDTPAPPLIPETAGMPLEPPSVPEAPVSQNAPFEREAQAPEPIAPVPGASGANDVPSLSSPHEDKPAAPEHPPPLAEETSRAPARQEQEPFPTSVDDRTSRSDRNRIVEEDEDAKRTVLLDIYNLERRGVRMTKTWTMDDRVEDMMLEVRRHALGEEEAKNVDFMKDGLRFVVSGIELLNKRVGILDLDGWAADVNRTIGKHDQNLHKIYRKYWMRGSGRGPELDIAMAIASSMGMHHMKQMMTKKVVRSKGRGRTSSYSFDAHASSSDSDEEEEGVPAART